MVSVVNITGSSDPDAVPRGQMRGKATLPPVWLVEAKARFAVCVYVCVKLIGPIWVSEDAHINDCLCHYSVAFNLVIFVCKTPATVLGEKTSTF